MSTAKQNNVPGTELLELQYIAHIVSRGDDAESRIQDILRYLDERGGLMRGRVMLADPAASEIYIRYAHGLTAAELEQGRYAIGEGVCGRVFAAGEPVLAASLDAAPADAAADALPPEQIAFIVVPIVRDYLPIGVLAAQRRPSHKRSPQCDLALLEVVASLITEVLSTDGQAPAWVPQAWIEPRSRRAPAGTEARCAGAGDPDSAARDLMLRMALQRHAEGWLHLAADLYLKLAEQHFGTEQTLLAKSKLLEIACYYEAKGNPRLAADVIERLRRALGTGACDDGARPAPAQRPQPWGDGRSWSTEWDSFGSSEGSGGIGVRIR
ncbi:GAF domain-containing protein [uncultured Thiodictyon sp.]|uniref:GAF domain-containing protein n=1 Tax=uncultured Thiodictyon sp. TaxID=1846217 RepID=UPI0025E0B1CA|nr:GAF domain-containing protein [uncultured Thiodictyon sp.]